jgi:hypothetical protein
LTRDDIELVNGVLQGSEDDVPIADEEVSGNLLDVARTISRHLFDTIAAGHAPRAYDGAQALTWAQSGRGYANVYLTGRPWLLADATRAWLADGFAPGALLLADRLEDIIPDASGVGDYKHRVLDELVGDVGFHVDAAFGNATTDIDAYLAQELRIPHEAIYIIGKSDPRFVMDGLARRHAQEAVVQVVEDSWDEVVGELEQAPRIQQPADFPAAPASCA